MNVLCVGSMLTLALLTCSCGKSGAPKTIQGTDAVANANALHGEFIAALKRLYWSDSDGFEKCVLEPETIVPEEPWAWEGLQAKFPALERATYDSFVSENERARPVAPLDRGAMKLHVLARTEAAELKAILLQDDPEHDYWDIFHRRYGNAVRVRLSAPGFSEDGQQGLIYYEAGFDWLAMWGSYCFLKREGARWKIAKEGCVWQS